MGTIGDKARPRAWAPVFAFLFFLLVSPAVSQDTAPLRPAPAPAAAPAVDLERMTSEYLSGMKARLGKMDHGPGKGAEGLRDRLIRLSMQRPLAGITQDTLTLLGDSKRARYGFFFLMPAVRWMSEPFLYPVELSSGSEAQNGEMDRIFRHILALKARGFSVTLDNVGDAALSPLAAMEYREYYRKLTQRFVETGSGELCFSLKLSALVYKLDSALARGPNPTIASAKRDESMDALADLLRIAAQAPDKRIFFRLDMEEYAYKDLTLALFRETVEHNRDLAVAPDGSLRLGVVVQAYLRDSASDLVSLAEWGREQKLRVPVRLVKGAYEKYEKQLAREKGQAKSPVYNFKASTDASYEALSAYLLADRAAFDPAFATHNLRTIARVMALSRVMGLDKKNVEFQMLCGMGDPIKRVVADLGYPLREYIPAGSWARGLKYAGRRFMELAGADNALARTMRGDYSAVDAGPPSFTGPEDVVDGRLALELFEKSLACLPANPR